MDPEDETPLDEDLIVSVSVNDDMTEYSLTVKASNEEPIDPHELIMAIEMWLHEVSQAEVAKLTPGTSLH